MLFYPLKKHVHHSVTCSINITSQTHLINMAPYDVPALQFTTVRIRPEKNVCLKTSNQGKAIKAWS